MTLYQMNLDMHLKSLRFKSSIVSLLCMERLVMRKLAKSKLEKSFMKKDKIKWN